MFQQTGQYKTQNAKSKTQDHDSLNSSHKQNVKINTLKKITFNWLIILCIFFAYFLSLKMSYYVCIMSNVVSEYTKVWVLLKQLHFSSGTCGRSLLFLSRCKFVESHYSTFCFWTATFLRTTWNEKKSRSLKKISAPVSIFLQEWTGSSNGE